MDSTLTELVEPALTTVTIEYESTFHAHPGETITIYPSPQTWSLEAPTSAVTTIYAQPATLTVTQIGIIVESNGVSAFATTVDIATTTIAGPEGPQPSPITIVVDPSNAHHGWNTWTQAQKGGLVAGIVIAGFILLVGLAMLLTWVMTRRKTWAAGEWRASSHPNYGVRRPVEDMSYHNGWLGVGWMLRDGGR